MNIDVKNSIKFVDYNESMKILEKRANDVFSGKKNEFLWLLEHNPVYTAGTSSNNSDLLNKKLKVIKTNRGGKYTYHGPGQKVVYFALNLNNRGKDIRKFVGMLIGLIGTILLFSKGELLGEGQTTFGIIAILASVVLAAWPNVYLKMQKTTINSYHLNAFGMTISGLLFFLFALILENSHSIPIDKTNMFAIFFLTIPGTVITWGIYIWLFNHIPVTQISYTAFYPPIIATFVGWLFLNESLPLVAIFGSILIIFGGYLVSSPSKS